MDALSPVLQRLRLRSLVGGMAYLQAPWGLSQGREAETAAFHLVARGKAFWRLPGDRWQALGPGSLLLLPQGQAHEICSEPGVAIRSLHDLMANNPQAPNLVIPGSGDRCTLLCGGFRLRHQGVLPLFALLPATVVLHPDSDWSTPFLQGLLQLMIEESSQQGSFSTAILLPLMDAFFTALVREGCRHRWWPLPGWLAAVEDPRLAKVLDRIHRHPDQPWTFGDLAQVAGLSRSAFAFRFRRLVGEPPIQYLQRWRIQLAQVMLEESSDGLRSVARRSGFATESAFIRSFKQFTEKTPGAYRRELRQAQNETDNQGRNNSGTSPPCLRK
ncbi:MAG: AraC family transcriptional regulator [Planctomycetota bacterium]|nr:MAG: AraC family transcriptional regulator [Planctomycetota bacterium]